MFIATSQEPYAAPSTKRTAPVVIASGVSVSATRHSAHTVAAVTTTGRLLHRAASRPTNGIMLSEPMPIMSSTRPMARGSSSSRSRVAGRRETHEAMTVALSANTAAVAMAGVRHGEASPRGASATCARVRPGSTAGSFVTSAILSRTSSAATTPDMRNVDRPRGDDPRSRRREAVEVREDYRGVTFSACGPFWPCVTSKVTFWFSSSER